MSSSFFHHYHHYYPLHSHHHPRHHNPYLIIIITIFSFLSYSSPSSLVYFIFLIACLFHLNFLYCHHHPHHHFSHFHHYYTLSLPFLSSPPIIIIPIIVIPILTIIRRGEGGQSSVTDSSERGPSPSSCSPNADISVLVGRIQILPPLAVQAAQPYGGTGAVPDSGTVGPLLMLSPGHMFPHSFDPLSWGAPTVAECKSPVTSATFTALVVLLLQCHVHCSMHATNLMVHSP